MSAPYSVDEAVRWTGGAHVGGPAAGAITATTIDSRSVAPGCLFVAIVGPNHDAHRFLAQSGERGARALMVNRDRADEAARLGPAVIAVEDTTRALGALAAGHRAGFTGPLLGITGSSGKTTTKEMAAAILSAKAPCLKTQGNLNNEFGVPLTLLRREPQHESAVVEMGMNHRGEIAHLAALAAPTAALVTNVGTAHIEFLGSREEIAREKGDLFAALADDGVAVVNHDDDFVVQQARRVRCRTLGYGLDRDAEVRADVPRFLSEGRLVFTLHTPWGTADLSVVGLGDTTVINATAAAAGALAVGVSLDHVVDGLERYRPIRGRMAPVPLGKDITLIDDTYNANPQSMKAALSSLAQLAKGGRSFAVLGEMGELGDTREAAHRGAGRAAAELGIDFLVALGESAEAMVEGAVEAGMDPAHARVAVSHADAGDEVGTRLNAGDWVLVKGSRAMRMEQVVELLTAEGGTR